MRPELRPTYRDLDAVEPLVERAMAAAEGGKDARGELAALERATGHTVTAADLDGWLGSADASTIAKQLTRPDDLRVAGITRGELVEIVRRFTPTDEVFDREHEDYWMALFDANVPHPDASNLLYHPPGGGDPTPEDVVDIALSYRPIRL